MKVVVLYFKIIILYTSPHSILLSNIKLLPVTHKIFVIVLTFNFLIDFVIYNGIYICFLCIWLVCLVKHIYMFLCIWLVYVCSIYNYDEYNTTYMIYDTDI